MDWNQVAEQNKQYFQSAIIDMAGSQTTAMNFIGDLKFFKFDLSNNMILYAIMKEPVILTDLYTVFQTGILKRIRENITTIKEKECTVTANEQMQMELLSLLGGRQQALDFLKELKQLGVDLTQDNKLALMHEDSEVFKLLSTYYKLGFITKIINTQQAIELILKKENIYG